MIKENPEKSRKQTIISSKMFLKIYPILLILLIPVLLVVNTLWSLKSFNRDANFIVRHQAVGIADSLKPVIQKSLSGGESDFTFLLQNIKLSSDDVLDISLLNDNGSDFNRLYSTNDEALEVSSVSDLGKLARGGEQSYAGLSFNPIYGKNVWNVVVPVKSESGDNFLLYFAMDTTSVTEIISRTTKDSIVILTVLIFVSLLMLGNHFYFYLRSLRTQQLEELDKMKDEFISVAAHELRAPVTAFNGYLDLLKSETVKNGIFQSIKDSYDMLIRIGGDLNILIDDLLNVSRIEQGRLNTEIIETDVSKIVKEVIEANNAYASEKDLKLLFEVKGEIPTTMSDPQRLRQVITNIISNSIKYTIQGSVTANVSVESKNIKIVVKDTGIGIPPDEMKKLFQKFQRVQDKQTSEVRGTGLGLWITKEIVEILGGKINLESIYGTGTSVTVLIPVRSDQK